MDVEIQSTQDAVIVSPSGDVDLATSRELQNHLRQVLAKRPARLVVDLSGVPYMDSSGVATLVEAMQICRRQSTELVLCSLQERVRSVFEIARLDRVFKIAADMEAACEC